MEGVVDEVKQGEHLAGNGVANIEVFGGGEDAE